METNWRWWFVAAVAPVAWGSTYYVTRHYLPADHALWGGVFRAIPAGLLLLALARRRPHGSWWWRSAVLGVLNMGAFFVLVYLAAQLLPSGVAATVMASSSLVLALVAWGLLAERPAAAQLVGAGVGLGGVALLLLGGAGGSIDGWGVAASLAAMLMSSVGFVLAKRWTAGGTDRLATTSWQLIAGGLAVLPVAVAVEGPPPVIDGPALLAFAYMSVVATALAFVAWFTALHHLPVATVGAIGLLNPLTGAALGTALAGETLAPYQWLGAGLVVVGVLAAVAPRRPAIDLDQLSVRTSLPSWLQRVWKLPSASVRR